jgi:Na+/H+-dicarboxylate symporter
MNVTLKFFDLPRYLRFATNPLTVISCVLVGIFIGWIAPEFSRGLTVVGVVYVDLLKMVVLPFMVSCVIYSMQKLFRDGGTGKIVGRVTSVILGLSVVTAVIAVGATLLIQPGTDLPPEAKAAFGRIVGVDSQTNDAKVTLMQPEAVPKPLGLQDLVATLIPTNIFAALAQGEILKALLFALFFGFAMGQVPSKYSVGLEQSLETVSQACQAITRWVNIPVPFVLICLMASQIGQTGLEPLRVMAGFVLAFLAISLALLALALVVLRFRSGCSFAVVLHAMRETFTLGVATNSSAVCMPAMVKALVQSFNYTKSSAELLVPLTASLLRTGVIAYLVCGTMFIAALYDRPLTATDIGIVIAVSVMSGFASIGMSGVLTVAIMSTACSYLGLPFEAAFILLVSVDPICSMARTAVTVVFGCAAVTLICPKPAQAEAPNPGQAAAAN